MRVDQAVIEIVSPCRSPSPRRRYRSAGCRTPQRMLWPCWGWSLRVRPDREREKGTEHFLPEVSVLVWESLAQIGSVTYLATRECLDLISGKVSDIAEVAEGCCRTEPREGRESGTMKCWAELSCLVWLIKCAPALTELPWLYLPLSLAAQSDNIKLVLHFTCKVWPSGKKLSF